MLARAGFGEICEGLCRWHSADAAPMRAAGLLRAWIEQGMLAAIDVASASG
jgi:EAL domain-containing protein (putative c-di-GMP-specific phosphodiesterase class I)